MNKRINKKIRENFKRAYHKYRKEFMKDTIPQKPIRSRFIGALGGFEIVVIDGTIWLRNYFDDTEVRLYRHEIACIITLLNRTERQLTEWVNNE